jgi:pSer/pThr/pTyr-binding forkhead associated (FHA) protein
MAAPGDDGQDLRAFAEKTKDLEEEGFLRKVDTPFLLVQDYSRETASTFSTGKTDIKPKRDAAPPGSLGRLLPVQKTERNAFSNMISVGRTPINDIILNHASVSKLHAFFQRAPDADGYLITDSDSRYGTTLDGVRLAPQKGFPVATGQTLVFGDAVQALYLSPAGLFEHIRSLRFFHQL